MRFRHKYLRSGLMWKLEDGNKEVRKLPCMNRIENLNLKVHSFIKRIHGATVLTEKELICVENWK